MSINAFADDEIWLLIDTKKMIMQVKQGTKTIETYKNIAIGRNGSAHKHKRGDDITPLGNYAISWVNDESDYYRFFGFDYPSKEDAKRALAKKIINQQTYNAIIQAHQEHQVPPQNTPLGGQIGIHGLGKADPRIHQMVNWTHGCIALTNQQIDALSLWIKKSTKVKVQ
jgi:murein L,D-transpeptidase YafK